ncbi:HNH endonuclease family protein [Amycolatopsis sp. CA-230715]|uniref:HNH endonuclease family protein n=1 Tax=Amycolatopsis sp. CA-230715 TaxID=2745196 RepID=UPI001C027216|nr:HNH endonuclease family protein [Amycolatopsis sp. CA-230715]
MAVSGCTAAADAGSASPPPVAPSKPPASPTSQPAARQQLAELAVGPRGSMQGYSRERFPHWTQQGGHCDTRETVLKRAGQGVTTEKNCKIRSGTWTSPYDGGTWTKPSDVDIDHMVPLGQAWVSGARSWTTERRREFANDLVRPQLFAVTDNVNQEKSDKAPDQWKPPSVGYWCRYATDWVTVKHYYGLTVTDAEKAALASMLDRCPPEG